MKGKGMRLVPCNVLELEHDERGPGPRNQSDASRTFTTMKVKSGEKEPTPTGLSILWDLDAHAFYLVRIDAKDNPCVCIDQSKARRWLPDTYDWIVEDATK